MAAPSGLPGASRLRSLTRPMGWLLVMGGLIACNLGAISRSTDSSQLPPSEQGPESAADVPTATISDPRTSELDPCTDPFAPTLPSAPNVLANDKLRVDFTGEGQPIGYTVSVYDGDGWYPLATSVPLARLAYARATAGPVSLELDAAELELRQDTATLTSSVTDPDGGVWQVQIRLGLGPSKCVLEVESTVTVDQARQLVLFASPMLDVGAGSFGSAKDTAVLGGLDWTIHGEESQANAAVPNPLNVSWPMMALSTNEHLVGVMWDPLQRWDGAHLMPQPFFASPNWIEAKDSHLFGLGLPNATEWMAESPLVDERDLAAKAAAAVSLVDRTTQPYPLMADQVLRLEASIVVDYPAEIPEAVQLYIDRYGLPGAPGFDLESGLEATMDAYLTTAWNPATAGWYQGTFGSEAPYITVAAQLAAYAEDADPVRSGSALDRIDQAFGAEWQTRHDPGPSSAHLDYLDFGFRTGDTAEVLTWSAGASAGARSSQRADGSWRYNDSGNICAGALADPDIAVLGTNVIQASIILEHARIARDEASVQAGLKALEYMENFIKPAGAQVGEVPLVHGDPWAVAWAVRDYVEGYRITGDFHYLELARAWAFKGIPFVYTWNAPGHPVMAYAVVGVMGTSCWTAPWAGTAVQWVGLDYAASILELAKVDSSFPWREVADGIARAATGMLDHRQAAPAGEWREIVLTTTAPVDVEGLGFSVRVNHELSLPGQTEFYVDEVSLTDLATGDNLIANGGFEAGGLDGFPWHWEGDSVELVSGDLCRTGRCVHAIVAGDEILSASADIPAPANPGHRYELRLWIRLAADPPPASGPLFRVEYFTALDTKWVSIFARPLVGLLPDFYDIKDQMGYAPILPERLGDVVLGLNGAALHVTTQPAGEDFAVSSLSEVVGVEVSQGGGVSFQVRPRSGRASYIVVALLGAPDVVTVDGKATDAWRWDARLNLLFLTVEHPDAAARAVEIN